jgi:hypothetical protein
MITSSLLLTLLGSSAFRFSLDPVRTVLNRSSVELTTPLAPRRSRNPIVTLRVLLAQYPLKETKSPSEFGDAGLKGSKGIRSFGGNAHPHIFPPPTHLTEDK